MAYEMQTEVSIDSYAAVDYATDVKDLILGNENYFLGYSADLEEGYAEKVLAIVNEERSKAGLEPVRMVEKLNEAAMIRSQELPTTYAHVRADGRQYNTVAEEVGYPSTLLSENINSGIDGATPYSNNTAEQAMDSWMNSSGHRQNILDERAVEMGIAAIETTGSQYQYYWTQLFSLEKTNEATADGGDPSSSGSGSNSNSGSDSNSDSSGSNSNSNPANFIVGTTGYNDILTANETGSSLWGGYGKTNDTLIGGKGADTFIYHYGEGCDMAFAGRNDTIDLSSVSWDDVRGVQFMEYNRMLIVFNDYGCLNVMGPAGEINIGGEKYTPDYEHKTLNVKAS